MENIRWILLLVGFLIVLGIYVYGRYQAGRDEGRDHAEQRPSLRPGADIDPLFDQPDDNEAVEAELERLEQLISEDSAQPQEPVADAGTAAKAPPPEPDKIVTLFVLAPKGVPFPGSFILEAMETAGLQFGDMDIFHCPDARRGGESLFSVASMVEPGTFDLSAMGSFTTSGLVLFLQLPGPAEPVQAFDRMVEAARSLAESLGGTVCDATRSMLTNQTIGHMREDVIDYQLRQRVAKTAS